MTQPSIGLGNIVLSQESGEDVSLRLTYEDDVFKLKFSSHEDKYFTLVLEDESDVSSLMDLLDTCFNFS